MSEDLQVVLIAATSALAVGLVGLLLAWVVRGWSIGWQLGLVAAVSIAAMLAGVQAAARAMFISEHDLGALTLVAAAAAVVSGVVALVLARAVSGWSRVLAEDVRRVGGPSAALEVAPRGPAEFRRLSEELSATHARLAEARDRQERLETSRAELVSWVSHDLRTPLAGMRAMTEALEDGMAPDPERYHAQIRTEIERMTRMVDDLFELSRIQAGVLRLQPEPVALGDVVSEAIAAADPVARTRAVEVGGRAADGPDGPAEVVADPSGLSRVVANLVANAVRHTVSGGTVCVEARALPGGGAELSVSDGCGGLGEEEMARVFDVAWQGSLARTPGPRPEEKGAGLGLAIVKGIVEAHGGRVGVENLRPAPGGHDGCRFVVTLPGVSE